MRRTLAMLTTAVTIVAAGACANASSAGDSTPTTFKLGTVASPRLIKIVMREYSFTPKAITAHVGETVRLRFVNKGTIRHEAVIGDETVQLAHAQAMAEWVATSSTLTPTTALPVMGRSRPSFRHPGMNAPNVVSVEAGFTGEVTYSLGKKAHLLIECHEIGHLEMGMAATLDVT